MTKPRKRAANETVAAGFNLRGKDAPVKGAATEGTTLVGDRAGFTLIEMLVVMVIMGIMVGIGIPAVTNLMKSGGLGAATRQVSNTLSQARQYAITQRVRTRVVFPLTDGGSLPDQQAMWYRAYAVMYRDAAGVWQYASKWEYLPVGVVFLNNVATLGSLDNLLNWTSEKYPTSTFPSQKLAYIEFNPTGADSLNSGNDTLAITEGFMTSGPLPTPTPTSKTSVGALVNVTIITVDNIVGRIKVTRP